MKQHVQATDRETKPLPTKSLSLCLDRLFTAKQMERLRAGLQPEQMEDKWFVYWQDDCLYFHRSWTGYCIYVIHFKADGDSYRMIAADVNGDTEQYSSPGEEQEPSMISNLIDRLLLRREPEDAEGGALSEDQTLKRWSQIGRAMLGQHPADE